MKYGRNHSDQEVCKDEQIFEVEAHTLDQVELVDLEEVAVWGLQSFADAYKQYPALNLSGGIGNISGEKSSKREKAGEGSLQCWKKQSFKEKHIPRHSNTFNIQVITKRNPF